MSQAIFSASAELRRACTPLIMDFESRERGKRHGDAGIRTRQCPKSFHWKGTEAYSAARSCTARCQTIAMQRNYTRVRIRAEDRITQRASGAHKAPPDLEQGHTAAAALALGLRPVNTMLQEGRWFGRPCQRRDTVCCGQFSLI